MKKRVAFIIGTRPEAIKIAALLNAMKKSIYLEPFLLTTGQHESLLDETLESLRIKPDRLLKVMEHNQTLSSLTSKLHTELGTAIKEIDPHLIIVQGDTSTALVGALEGFYNKIPIGHLESGLRTSNISQPFPEELNRRLISVMSSLNFTPTDTATQNLLLENIDPSTITMTGNTGIDTLLETTRRIISEDLSVPIQIKDLFQNQRIVLVTCHRRESFGAPLVDIMHGLTTSASLNPDVKFIFPVHPNPNVKKIVNEALGNLPNFLIIDPLPYVDLVAVLNRAELIVTDSGGLQEEAPALGKRTIVMRDLTERSEAVEAGYSELVGSSSSRIVEAICRNLEQGRIEQLKPSQIFGDGKAADRVINAVIKYLDRSD